MSLDGFWQSLLANSLLIAAYILYKLCDRVVRSNCHYSTADGLTFDLPDPEDPVDTHAINTFL
jgi:hypothetical protein